MANVPAQHQDKLEVGSEVLFNIMTDARGNETVISLAILPPGSLPEKQTSSSKQMPKNLDLMHQSALHSMSSPFTSKSIAG